jgi:thioredoxin reductase
VNGLAQSSRPVIIIGAGPYGLSAAAHLRAAGVDVHVVGDPMVFWRRNMPEGMLLRSAWEASHIADPHDRLTLDRYAEDRGRPIPVPIPLADFIAYGEWFQQRVVPEVDRRRVAEISRLDGGFRLRFDEGEDLAAERVVVATGLNSFPRRPPAFDGFGPQFVSHSSEHRDLSSFAGRRVLVIGGGQSALESAALLAENGAEADVLIRAPLIHWLPEGRVAERLGRARRLLYPPTDVGPPGLNWIAALPDVFRAVPYSLQGPLARRCIRPAGAFWLRARLAGVPLETSRPVTSVTRDGEGLVVRLADGQERRTDHIMLATGYRIDVDRYDMLAPELRAAVHRRLGHPLLRPGFESSVAGLHFIGAAAAESFGPIMRFVTGTGYTGRGLARAVSRAPAGQLRLSALRRRRAAALAQSRPASR